MADKDLQGRVAIVTGAGSGIGRAIALKLAEDGARVAVVDVIAARAEETVRLVEQQGGEALGCAVDITDEAGIAGAVARVVGAWGGIDILCNNAGKMDQMQVAPDTDLANWNRVLEVNATGTFVVLRAVLPHMIARGSGTIVNTASAAGMRGGSAGIAYTAAKHAVVGITRSVAAMHLKDGIRCNAVCPGAVNTDIMGTANGPLDQTGMARIAPVLASMPAPAEPDRIAEAVRFLVSDRASYINGAILPVDAGWSAC